MVWWSLYNAKGGCCVAFGLGHRKVCVGQILGIEEKLKRVCLHSFAPVHAIFVLNPYLSLVHPFNMLFFFFVACLYESEQILKILFCFI